MNGVHDMGGLECFGPINPDPNEQKFRADWERRVLALTLAMGATGQWNLDQARSTRELLPPAEYLSIGYYRIWFEALEDLLLERGLVTVEEIEQGRALSPGTNEVQAMRAKNVTTVLRKGSPVDRSINTQARFAIGDRVCVRNIHAPTHTRLPGYIRGKTGVVKRVHGAHIYADTHALGLGDEPQWLYNVRFEAADLWGEPRQQSSAIHVDCWEPYLQELT